MRVRYRFGGPMRVGDRTKLPSGRIYCLRQGGEREFEIAPEDAPALLEFRGECCTGGKKPLFELVE